MQQSSGILRSFLLGYMVFMWNKNLDVLSWFPDIMGVLSLNSISSKQIVLKVLKELKIIGGLAEPTACIFVQLNIRIES